MSAKAVLWFALWLALGLVLPRSASAADASLVIRIMVCESGLKHDAWGDDGKSYGIAQFRKETFYEFATMAKKEMREAGFHKPNWHNPQHQVFLLAWGLDNGYARRWTCYRMLVEGCKGTKP